MRITSLSLVPNAGGISLEGVFDFGGQATYLKQVLKARTLTETPLSDTNWSTNPQLSKI